MARAGSRPHIPIFALDAYSAAQTKVSITRIINYRLKQYSSSPCRVPLEYYLNACLFRKRLDQQAPSLAPAHHVISHASIPTIWLRYVIIYPAPLSHLSLLTSDARSFEHCSSQMAVFTSRAFARESEPSSRRIGYDLEMTSTNEYVCSTDLLAVRVDLVAPRRTTTSSKVFP